MVTNVNVKILTATKKNPPFLVFLFGWAVEPIKKHPTQTNSFWRPSFLCWSFLTLQAPLPFQWELDQWGHPWTSKCPPEAQKCLPGPFTPKNEVPSKDSRIPSRIGCLWSIYVQIYKHKDVVSLQISSSPNISAIFHQHRLPFVAGSCVFPPVHLPGASHQRRWKMPRSFPGPRGQAASQMTQL